MLSHNSNLDAFLSCTTPTAPSQTLPKTCIRRFNAKWNTIEYFNLGDLWDCYDEWSACGVGVPINIGNEKLIQYYSPYLSAIQLYTDRTLYSRDDIDGESDFKSWTSESEEGRLSRTSSNDSEKIWDVDTKIGHDTYWAVRNHLGHLCFEYFEHDVPFQRIPLKDKINELAQERPHLKSLRSFDLLPASWMAVAWYPIYHIPASRHSKELCASFLTYHTLSSAFQETSDDAILTGSKELELKSAAESNSIALRPFGMVAYRLQSKIWLGPDWFGPSKMCTLINAADSWLKQLRVHHHDFEFYLNHTP